MRLSFAIALICLAGYNCFPMSEVPDQDPDLFEGDIKGYQWTNKGLARIPNRDYVKWEGGVVPYVIDSNTYSAQELATIQEGIRWIEDQTRVNGRDCIKFVRRTNERTFIRIHSGSGCWSYVGKQTTFGEQLLSLKRPTEQDRGSCMSAGTTAHELIHALGFWHEQSRPDRDEYVKVNYENINPSNAHNFNKYDDTVSDTLDLPYDYYSVMHYAANAFSTNGLPTIEPLEPGIELVHSSRRPSLSDIDVQELRKYYNCG